MSLAEHLINSVNNNTLGGYTGRYNYHLSYIVQEFNERLMNNDTKLIQGILEELSNHYEIVNKVISTCCLKHAYVNSCKRLYITARTAVETNTPLNINNFLC
jgi:Mn-containing catalase